MPRSGTPTVEAAKLKASPGVSARLLFPTVGNVVTIQDGTQVRTNETQPANTVVKIMTGDGMSYIQLPGDTSQAPERPAADECDFFHRVHKVLDEYADVTFEVQVPDAMRVQHNDLAPSRNGKPFKALLEPGAAAYYIGSRTIKFWIAGVCYEVAPGTRVFVVSVPMSRTGGAHSVTKGVAGAVYTVKARLTQRLRLEWRSQRYLSENYALTAA